MIPCGNSRITEYQRLTTYGLDPLGKPSYGYAEDRAYNLRLTASDSKGTTLHHME